MKKKESFLLHIIKDEKDPNKEIKGKVIQIKTGATGYFEQFEQLERIISRFLKKDIPCKKEIKKRK